LGLLSSLRALPDALELGELSRSSNWSDVRAFGEFVGKSFLVGVGTKDCLELDLGGIGVLDLAGLSKLDLEKICSLFLAGVTFLDLGLRLDNCGRGLFRARFDIAEHGLKFTLGIFSFNSLTFNGVLACLLGDSWAESSICPVLFDTRLRGLLMGVSGFDSGAAFLLDLGVLRRASGSDIGAKILRLEVLLESSPLDTSSISTGFTALPALDLVFRMGKSNPGIFDYKSSYDYK